MVLRPSELRWRPTRRLWPRLWTAHLIHDRLVEHPWRHAFPAVARSRLVTWQWKGKHTWSWQRFFFKKKKISANKRCREELVFKRQYHVVIRCKLDQVCGCFFCKDKENIYIPLHIWTHANSDTIMQLRVHRIWNSTTFRFVHSLFLLFYLPV